MREIEAGVFDIGGVLHPDLMSSVHGDILKYLAVDKLEYKRAWKDVSPALGTGEISQAEFWRRLLEKLGKNIQLPEESLLLAGYTKRYHPNEEVIQTVVSLRLAGYKLAVLSNTIEPHVEFLKAKGLLDYFEVHIFSNEVGLSKPDPKIYFLTLDRLGLPAKKVFFVDDREENIRTAQEVGITGILFKNPGQLRYDLQQMGILVSNA